MFNFDEAVLVYCATLDGNFVCAEADHDGRKKSKERIITIEHVNCEHRLRGCPGNAKEKKKESSIYQQLVGFFCAAPSVKGLL